MSLGSDTIELVRSTAYRCDELAQDGDGEVFTISGIAIGEGDVTRGESGIEKRWTRDALKPAVDSLEGRPLVKDHDNSTDGVVGEVSRTAYQDQVGIIYQAELYDESLADKVKNGLLEVSIRGYHSDISEMQEDDEGRKIVEDLVLDNLSIVPTGAAPSNTVSIGESQSISAAECAGLLAEEGDDDGVELENQSTMSDESCTFSKSHSSDTSDTSDTTDTSFNNRQNMTMEESTDKAEETQELEELQERIEDLEDENESLRSEVETVRMEYAEDLAETSPFDAEELSDKFTVGELSEKAAEIETTELDESEPVPQTGTPDEEELSTSDEDDDKLEEIEELEEKVAEYERLGMEGARQSTESRIKELRD